MKEKLQYNKYKNFEKKTKTIVDKIASIRLITFFVMIISFIGKYYYYQTALTIIFIISLITFIVLVIVHDKYYKEYDYYAKYVSIIESYLARKNSNWKKFPDTGSDFLTSKSPSYLEDLDILGNNSLFQYLSICKTKGGRERLLAKLSNPKISSSNLKKEQEAIQELANNPGFNINFQIALSKYDNKKIHLSNNYSYLTQKISSKTSDLIIAIILTIICLAFLILGLTNVIPMRYFYTMFLFNFVISSIYEMIYQSEFTTITKVIQSYGNIGSIFDVVTSSNFSTEKLKNIQKDINSSKDNLQSLARIETLSSLKSNFLSMFILNGLGCLNLILMYMFTKFLSSPLNNLKTSLTDLEELEALISLSTIGITYDQKCMPIITDKVSLNFENLKHPLLDEKICVPNDFSCQNGVQIITGSNMGGKTSFLRTIGINLILMYSGSYVCATNFSASYLKIFTSMRISDDIEKGISTFYGELLRIKEATSYNQKGSMLVLIDEIFKGTNYQDRMYGAREVIKELNTPSTITFITTHDFELCDEKNVSNYHVKEYYEGDKIMFDYKIRKGKCTSTNAKYLMKKLGIIK